MSHEKCTKTQQRCLPTPMTKNQGLSPVIRYNKQHPTVSLSLSLTRAHTPTRAHTLKSKSRIIEETHDAEVYKQNQAISMSS
jgi:hypothetical protein